MQAVNNDNFGPLVAYLVPGGTVLLGFSRFSPTLQTWFTPPSGAAPSIGGFLYLTVASIAAGMVVSAVRWACVDTVHAKTGLPPAKLDFSRLNENVAAFELLISIHYRHYLYYSNMFIAVAAAYLCYRVDLPNPMSLGWTDLGFVLLETVFFATSRDTLRKYYQRSEQLLSAPSADVAASDADDGTICPSESRALVVRQSQVASHPMSGKHPAAE